MRQLPVKCTSVTVLLYALQLRDLFKVQPIKHFKAPCGKDVWSIHCFQWIQKKEEVGIFRKKVEVRNGLFTQERKSLRTASAGNLKLDIPRLDRGCSFFK